MLNRFAFDHLPADLLHVTPLADWIGFCVLKASVVECQLIPLINTIDWQSIGTLVYT